MKPKSKREEFVKIMNKLLDYHLKQFYVCVCQLDEDEEAKEEKS